MSNDRQENEVKFLLSDPKRLEARLIELGAILQSPRTHELNLRFDTPDGAMTAAHRVLRLRKDREIHLAYKGPSDLTAPIISREEIEFEADNFDAAQAFLLALGYHVSVTYEKYRTTYNLNDVEVVLDEMPYGMFCEIEGKDENAIAAAARALNLKWEHRSLESYLMIFNRVKSNLHLTFNDLTFVNFKGLVISPADLALTPAD